MKALLLVAVAFVGAPQGLDPIEPLHVSNEMANGTRWWTVNARSIPLEHLLEEIGHRGSLEIEGLDSNVRSSLVTVKLERRPIEQILEYVLGSLGLTFQLTRDSVTISPEVAMDDGELLGRASVSWLRATARFPEHELAPSARLAQGEISELSGNAGAARSHYQTLIDSFPNSSVVEQAYIRLGRILKRLEQWNEAATSFRALANRPGSREYRATAMLELARCQIELGDPESASYLLETLDADYPTSEPVEITERMFTKAQALNARGQHMEALQTLDSPIEQFDPIGQMEAWRIRAIALEGVGMMGEAARAWLFFSHDSTGQEKANALLQAVRLSLDAGDELGALFACKEAEAAGFGNLVLEERNEARRRLGLSVEVDTLLLEPLKRVELAESWIDHGHFERAATVFEPLFLRSASLEEPIAVRVCIGWARCLETIDGLETAIQTLSSVRSTFESLDSRSALDVAAANLFEKHDLFEQAVDAYAGRY